MTASLSKVIRSGRGPRRSTGNGRHLGPLKKVVKEEWDNGVLHETYECGHTTVGKKDLIGYTTASRRRCGECRSSEEETLIVAAGFAKNSEGRWVKTVPTIDAADGSVFIKLEHRPSHAWQIRRWTDRSATWTWIGEFRSIEELLSSIEPGATAA